MEWTGYWGRLKDEKKVFFLEAVEYVSRLRRTVAVSDYPRVLDFGCGFGYVAQVLASHVKEVYLWDQAENMRNSVRANVSTLKNAVCIEASSAEEFPRGLSFDLILVNSVIQYMPEDDLLSWLQRWKGMLLPGGLIIISDILPRHVRALSEIFSLISFSAGRGFLFRALWKGLVELKWYFKMRKSSPLRRYGASELEQIAARAGLVISILPQNLTFRKSRLSVTFSWPGN